MLRRKSLLTVVLLILAVGFLITDVSHFRPEITVALQETSSLMPKVREPPEAFQKARDWFMWVAIPPPVFIALWMLGIPGHTFSCLHSIRTFQTFESVSVRRIRKQSIFFV